MNERRDALAIPSITRNALRPLFRSSALNVLLCLFIGTSVAQTPKAATSLLHREAPEFVRTGLNHRSINLRAYRGKVVLLDFWATWCASCQLEMPCFVAWQSQYGPRGLQIIGISMDDDPALAQKLYKKMKLNYPVAMGDEKLGQLYGGVLGLPLAFLIDGQGKVQAQFQGETDLNLIEEQFKFLLRP
jgi:cytochrome c biogenesis protein CcmG/thiol:disulfide interchange protein DsbE